jgi:uncharacterized membrane protein YphA (DoxX/SURF4 family)
VLGPAALIDGIGGGTVALLLCRVVVGAFFVISGAHKLISPARHQAMIATLKASRIPYLGLMSWFVPGVELSAGLGVAFGFLAPLAALGLICILTVRAPAQMRHGPRFRYRNCEVQAPRRFHFFIHAVSDVQQTCQRRHNSCPSLFPFP